ncbi:hypothetical protein V6N13_107523 [Hibiscus sabdariffa]|uniref:Uncharacterized protein n=1 Tax=Hibiscus sabdariffa TaxID=183260 RepID=A0ABR2SPW1_9ROSI
MPDGMFVSYNHKHSTAPDTCSDITRLICATKDNDAWIFEVDGGIVRASQCYMLFYVQKQLYHEAIEDLSFVRISLNCTEIHSHLQLVVPLMQNSRARKADQREFKQQYSLKEPCGTISEKGHVS